MSLIHLLLIMVPADLGALSAAWFLAKAGVTMPSANVTLLLLPIALFLSLLCAWPVCRRFGLLPLMVFSGPCPGCQTRPPGWRHNWDGASDSMVLACGLCGTV